MYEFAYHLNNETNDLDFGVLKDGHLLVLSPETSLSENQILLDLINTVKSFKIAVDHGNATATFERGYWYVSKKIRGKLYRKYLGKTEDISETLLEDKVSAVNNQWVKEGRCNWDDHLKEFEEKGKRISERQEQAGHQKYANQLQTNLILVDEELSMVKNELAALKATLEMSQNDYMVLHEQLRTAQRDRLKIIEEKDAIAKDLLVYSTNHRNFKLGVAVAQERIAELENNLGTQTDLRKVLDNEHKEALTRISELESKLNEKDLDIDACLIVYERLEDKFAGYRMFIEKYRDLTKGKDKRNHPRFAYLIDFLAEIDNLT